MVATVGDDGDDEDQRKPNGDGGQVGSHDDGTHHRRQHVGDHMLNRMCVEGDHTNGSCPLVVFLVDFLVEFWVVKEAGKRVNS